MFWLFCFSISNAATQEAMDGDADYQKGMNYFKGVGVEQNYSEAYKWFEIAFVHGNLKAVMPRYDVSQKMSQQEIADAKFEAMRILLPELANASSNVNDLQGLTKIRAVSLQIIDGDKVTFRGESGVSSGMDGTIIPVLPSFGLFVVYPNQTNK